MPVTRSTAKLAASKDSGPYKPNADLRGAKTSKDTSNTTDTHLNTAASRRTATVLPRKKGTREMCTELQKAELETFYALTEGQITEELMKQIAENIGKSYDSTKNWMRNRRQKAKTSTAKLAADTAESHDVAMLDFERLEEPVEGLAISFPPPTNEKKPKRRTVKAPARPGGASNSTRPKRQPAAMSSSLPTRSSRGIDNSKNEATTMDLDQPSGDSNGSASPPANPGITQPIIKGPRVPTRPERPFGEYDDHEIHAASGIALIIPRMVNEAYNPKDFICEVSGGWMIRSEIEED